MSRAVVVLFVLAAYSDLAILPNGKNGLLFEKGGYQTVEFVTIPAPLAEAPKEGK